MKAKALVQVLASNAPLSGIAALCDAWGVPLGFDSVETIRARAKHALEHGREEKE
jgi:lipopolysaccharide export LptBFGC system permease protein LptF